MKNIIFIGSPELSAGFNFAGVDTLVVDKNFNLKDEIEKLINEKTDIIIIEESFIQGFESFLEDIEKKNITSVIITIPSITGGFRKERLRLLKLIKEALGVEI